MIAVCCNAQGKAGLQGNVRHNLERCNKFEVNLVNLACATAIATQKCKILCTKVEQGDTGVLQKPRMASRSLNKRQWLQWYVPDGWIKVTGLKI